MKRFYFGDENEDEEDSEDPMEMFPDPSEFISMTQFENPDHHIINCSIKICEKSWFWNFYKISKKTKMVQEVFESLKKLLEGNKNAEI
jgi:hypothetical protein